MRVALVVPVHTADIIREVVENKLDYINLDVLIYDSYTEAVEMTIKSQGKYDGIVFAGIVLYNFVKCYVKEECIWGYFPLHESSFSFALLEALYSNRNIKNLSIDTYSMDTIEDVYNSIGISIKDVNVMLYDVPYDSMNITEEAATFHKNNLEKYKDISIITALSDANKSLERQGIRSYMAIPTKSIIIDTFQKLYLRYTAKINTNSRIVAIFIQIDFPEDFSIISRNEYYYVKEKNKISEHIYEFASKIEAAVIELGFNTYVVISTKKILETETENYKKIDILKTIGEDSLNRISMGIGYGITAGEAKYKANEAMRKAREYTNENIAYVIYEDGKTVGPIRYGIDEKKDSAINDRLIKIAEVTNVSIKKILAFYNAVDICKKDKFTAKELSTQCDMSYRTVNRVINKLEMYGYVTVVGKHFEDGSGRPQRIIKFNF